MAKTDGLRIGKGSLGTSAGIMLAVIGAAAAHAGQLAERIGSLEKQVVAIESRHDAEQEATQRQLDYLTKVVDKIWGRLDK